MFSKTFSRKELIQKSVVRLSGKKTQPRSRTKEIHEGHKGKKIKHQKMVRINLCAP